MGASSKFIKQLSLLGHLKTFMAESQFKCNIYVDSSDVIKTVVGYRSLYNRMEVFNESFFDSTRFFVQNLIFSKKLGKVGILSPHQSELSFNIQKDFGIRERYISPELLDRLITDTKTYRKKQANQEVNELIDDTTIHGESDFKVAVSAFENSWQERLAKLFDKKSPIVQLSDDSKYFPEITTTTVFRQLLSKFKEKRKNEDRKNFNDALCLAIILKKVEEFNKHRKTIPLFYASEALFKEVIQDLNIEEQFEVIIDDHSESVIRTEDYFIVHAIFDNRKKQNDAELVAHYEEIEDFKQEFDELQSDGSNIFSFMKLNDKIENYRKHSFLRHILIDNYQSADYREVYNSMQLNTSKFDEDFKKSLDEKINVLKSDLNRNLEAIVKYNSLVSSFKGALLDFRLELDGKTRDIECFKDLALVRFSLPKEVVTELDGDIANLDASTEELTAMNLASLLLKEDLEPHTYQKVLAILWLVKMDDVLVEYSENHREHNYQVTLLYMAARVRKGEYSYEEFENDRKYLHSLMKEHPTSEKHIKLGLAYLTYHLEDLNQTFTVTEKIPEEVSPLHQLSMKYATEAYDLFDEAAHLANPKKNTLYKLYALNLLIYYTVEIGTKEHLFVIESLFNQFSNEKDQQSPHWNYRFTDTIARYYHRKHVRKDRHPELLALAKRFSQEAYDRATLKSDIIAYYARMQLKE